jgi:O-antigen/teichoic acid export membrane protein
LNSKKILGFIFGPVVGFFLSFLLTSTYTWIFSTVDLGRFGLLVATLNLVSTVFSLGLNQALMREFYETKDKKKLFLIAIFPGFALITIIQIFFIDRGISTSLLLFEVKSFKLEFLIYASMIFIHLNSFLSLLSRLREQSRTYSYSQIIPKLFVIGILAYSYLRNYDLSFSDLILFNFLVFFFTFLILVTSNLDYIIINLTFKSFDLGNVAYLKKLLSYSFPLTLGGLAIWALNSVDRFFCEYYLDYKFTGVYSVGLSFTSVISLVSLIVSTLYFPIAFRWAKDKPEIFRFTLIFDGVLVLITFIWSFIGVFSTFLIKLFPIEYEVLDHLLVLIIAGPLMSVLSDTTSIGLGITRKSFQLMAASIAALIVVVLLFIFLIPKFGILGIATSSSISFFVFFLLRTELSAKAWQQFPRKKLYIFIILYLFYSILFSLFNVNEFFARGIWIILFITVVYTHRQSLVYLFQDYLKKFNS